ncbi:MAG: hypothetical protein IH943_11320 [Acidobacteria bacterium]|nr:hypothetical protein [Acidobacteriota bacterium]
MNNGQHSRRLDVISRRLTPDPDQPMTLEHVSQAITELERDPATTTLLGMPIEVCMSLVEAEIQRLEAELNG